MACNDKADLKNRLKEIEDNIHAHRAQIEQAKQKKSELEATIHAWDEELANLLKEREEIQTELNS